jgi:transcription elongation factor Elf1
MRNFYKARKNAQVESARQQRIIEEKLAQMSAGAEIKPVADSVIQIKQFVCPECAKATERCICNPVSYIMPIICTECGQLAESCGCRTAPREVRSDFSEHDAQRVQRLQNPIPRAEVRSVKPKISSTDNQTSETQRRVAIAKIRREMVAKTKTAVVSTDDSSDLDEMW